MCRRIVILLGLLLATAHLFEAKGQKHELRFTYGLYSVNTSQDHYTDVFRNIFKGEDIFQANAHTTGCYALSYRHRLVHSLYLGCTLAYEQQRGELFSENGSGKQLLGSRKMNFYNATLDLQLRYLQIARGVLTLYGSAGAGVTLSGERFSSLADYKNLEPEFAYQFSPLGLTLGLRWFGLFAEVGYGYRGIVQAGAYVRF